jgi:hypothetical protein
MRNMLDGRDAALIKPRDEDDPKLEVRLGAGRLPSDLSSPRSRCSRRDSAAGAPRPAPLCPDSAPAAGCSPPSAVGASCFCGERFQVTRRTAGATGGACCCAAATSPGCALCCCAASPAAAAPATAGTTTRIPRARARAAARRSYGALPVLHLAAGAALCSARRGGAPWRPAAGGRPPRAGEAPSRPALAARRTAPTTRPPRTEQFSASKMAKNCELFSDDDEGSSEQSCRRQERRNTTVDGSSSTGSNRCPSHRAGAAATATSKGGAQEQQARTATGLFMTVRRGRRRSCSSRNARGKPFVQL